MNIISVDDLVSRPITVMNTIQEAVRVESRFDYTQALRWVSQKCYQLIICHLRNEKEAKPS